MTLLKALVIAGVCKLILSKVSSQNFSQLPLSLRLGVNYFAKLLLLFGGHTTHKLGHVMRVLGVDPLQGLHDEQQLVRGVQGRVADSKVAASVFVV